MTRRDGGDEEGGEEQDGLTAALEYRAELADEDAVVDLHEDIIRLNDVVSGFSFRVCFDTALQKMDSLRFHTVCKSSVRPVTLAIRF